MRKDLDQRQQGGEANFVIFAANAFLQLGQADFAPTGLYHLTRNRNLDAQKLISFPILSGTRLEKAGKAGHLGGVGFLEH